MAARKPPPYIPGTITPDQGPLARYLPPIPRNVVSSWLTENIVTSSWILEPFAASPHLPIEIARAGYRCLVTVNNPINRFLLELYADPPTQEDLQAVLAELASSYKGDQRLEPYIQSLYETECAQCNQVISAEAFIWERGANAPSERLYTCPHCGDHGEHPVTQEDVALATRLAVSRLPYARALERVASADDPDRSFVEEALTTYPPRALHALFTIINKLEGMEQPEKRGLIALTMVALDYGNTLWPYPSTRLRPRQLNVPARYRENNIWLALEETIKKWPYKSTEKEKPVPIVNWPEDPSSGGGICIFEGRIKDLIDLDVRTEIKAVVTILPRPNQAYWTLSALWAGWLWGREAIASFRSVLRRRRYDWSWHSDALHAAFTNIYDYVNPDTRFFSLISEVEPGFLSAAILAGAMAGFSLDGIALRVNNAQAQLHWYRQEKRSFHPVEIEGATPESITWPHNRSRDISQEAAHAYIKQRGEPVEYIQIHCFALTEIEKAGLFQETGELSPSDVYTQFQNSLLQAFTYRSGFMRIGGSPNSLEVGLWWVGENIQPDRARDIEPTDTEILPTSPGVYAIPLSDRVEMEIVRVLSKQPGITIDQLDKTICEDHPDLMTPEYELIEACLNSYAVQEPADSGKWYLRHQDKPTTRRADLSNLYQMLEKLGRRLNYQVMGNGEKSRSQVWFTAAGDLKYIYYLVASAVFGNLFLGREYPPSQSILVYPGSRAKLISFKLESNPLLGQLVEQGWRLVKFRHIHHLFDSEQIDSQQFDEALEQDPLSNTDPQIPLL